MFTEWIPTVRKVLLQPSTETIVRDVASMAGETWTYKDLLVPTLEYSFRAMVRVSVLLEEAN